MNDLDDDLIISKIEEILSRETIYFPSNIQITMAEEDSKIIITLLDKYLTLKQNSIPKQKVKDLMEKEKLPLTIIGGRKNGKTLAYGIKLGKIKAYKELLEEK